MHIYRLRKIPFAVDPLEGDFRKNRLSKKNRKNCHMLFASKIPKTFPSGVAYKFQNGIGNKFYYGECSKHFAVLEVRNKSVSQLELTKGFNQKMTILSAVCY